MKWDHLMRELGLAVLIIAGPGGTLAPLAEEPQPNYWSPLRQSVESIPVREARERALVLLRSRGDLLRRLEDTESNLNRRGWNSPELDRARQDLERMLITPVWREAYSRTTRTHREALDQIEQYLQSATRFHGRSLQVLASVTRGERQTGKGYLVPSSSDTVISSDTRIIESGGAPPGLRPQITSFTRGSGVTFTGERAEREYMRMRQQLARDAYRRQEYREQLVREGRMTEWRAREEWQNEARMHGGMTTEAIADGGHTRSERLSGFAIWPP